MILVAGGMGRLGTQVVRLLTERRLEVRILTRNPAKAEHRSGMLFEVVLGDLRDEQAVMRAASGARTVVSAIHGFIGTVAPEFQEQPLASIHDLPDQFGEGEASWAAASSPCSSVYVV